MSGLDKRRALGKGLESLLPSKQAVTSEESGHPREIPVELISPSRFQTRMRFDEVELNELAQSISATGVVQPVIVRQSGDKYELIAGERRWRASRIAGKATIPAVIRQVSDEQAMEMTIVENLQRTDLNPMEQARAYDRLAREFKLTQEQMAQKTGKDRTSVANFMRLLKLPVEVQHYVEAGELSFGHARTLLALESTAQMEAAARKVMALSMSVRQTESFVKGLLDPERKLGKIEAVADSVDPNVREAEIALQRALGLKVKIEDKNGRGRVTIEYGRLAEFDTLYEMLTK